MSLRGRLLIAAAAMVLIALVVADVATYSRLHSYLYAQVDRSLDTAHGGVEQVVVPLLSGARGRPSLVLAIPGGYIEVRDSQDQVIIASQPTEPPPELPAHITSPAGSTGETRTYFNASAGPGKPLYRVRASSLASCCQLIIAAPLGPQISTLRYLALVELAVAALALVGVAALGWWLVGLSLRPLADMEQTAAAITEAELGRRVPGDNATTEVGRLARTLNTMLGRIQDAFAARDATEAELRKSEERLRRFVADASHELRTPLAAVGAYAELFERGADERPQDLARVMTGIRAETARMGDLVEDLLLLARLDEGRPLQHDAVELVGVAAEAVRAAVAVGPDWPVKLVASQAVEVIGDAARIRQVMDNLLSNVRAHTPPGTSTRVRIAIADGYGTIEVADNGPGLPADTHSLVFERFYRLDSSRSRNSGGSGLGLAIVAAIVAAQHGRVAAIPTEGGGATFTVSLPLATAAALGDGRPLPTSDEEVWAPAPAPAPGSDDERWAPASDEQPVPSDAPEPPDLDGQTPQGSDRPIPPAPAPCPPRAPIEGGG